MEVAVPQWLWMLAAAPGIALLAALGWYLRLRATTAWAARGLWDRLLPGYSKRRLVAWSLFLALTAGAIGAALARPRWGEAEQQVERQGVDVIFVLDTSLSMATRDVLPSRLWIAQTLLRRMIRELPGHRVALIQAEGDGVVVAPLTSDTAVIELLLDSIHAGSLPTPGTELRPALERAFELFPAGGDKHRALVLLSDGEDHGSGIDKMSSRLRDESVVVHTLGVGTLAGKPLELPRFEPGTEIEYKRDETGNVVVSRLMEEKLQQLSRTTGGVYLHATSAAVELQPIVAPIRNMEARGYGSELISARAERFQWPIAIAIFSLVLLLGYSPFRAARGGLQ